MKKWLCIILALFALSACSQKPVETETAEGPTTQEVVYMNITAQEAKEIMDTQEGYIILDTRAQDEYDESHIPGAILIPHDEILEKAESLLTDKDQMILVYCRS